MSKIVATALSIHRTMTMFLSPHREVFFHSLSHSLKYRNKTLIDLYFMHLWTAVIQDLYAEGYREN